MAIVEARFTSHSIAYISRLLEGSIQGTAPNISISPKIRPLVDALYQVLAGGSVTVSATGAITVSPGLPAVFNELKDMEQKCTDDINKTNATVGYSYVMEF